MKAPRCKQDCRFSSIAADAREVLKDLLKREPGCKIVEQGIDPLNTRAPLKTSGRLSKSSSSLIAISFGAA
jgi:hypothetical protein